MRLIRTMTFILLGVLLLMPFEASADAEPLTSAGAGPPRSERAPGVTGSAEIISHAAEINRLRYAQRLLRSLQNRYQLLDGVTVRYGTTPGGEEAVAYYRRGEILIDVNHTVGTPEILAHEIWHIIDWRDNGQLDWGENLPPRNAIEYE